MQMQVDECDEKRDDTNKEDERSQQNKRMENECTGKNRMMMQKGKVANDERTNQMEKRKKWQQQHQDGL